MTVLYFGNTRSGLPGNVLSWSLYRKPCACKNLRTSNSGLVLALHILSVIVDILVTEIAADLPGDIMPTMDGVINLHCRTISVAAMAAADVSMARLAKRGNNFHLSISVSFGTNNGITFQGFHVAMVAPFRCLMRSLSLCFMKR